MRDRVVLGLLVQGLTLFLLSPACEASSFGAVVHIVPQNSTAGTTVRAHFMVISPNPCPTFSGVCATGEDCMVYPTSLPFTGTKPASGWCVRQWQRTIPSNYSATVTLGSNVEFYLSVKAGPTFQANSSKLNQPPYVALSPPLRARVNCPHHIHLAVKDLDGDRVRCRFAREDQGECHNCTLHSFIELDEEKCMLVFTGKAAAGHYAVVVVAEDFPPMPRMSLDLANEPLSSIPVHLSLTVEKASSSCSAEPVATGQTPREGTTMYILPYEQIDITVDFISELESVSEVAVVGPPDLFRSGRNITGSLTTMSVAWVRGPNKLAPLLPICFAANTNSLQSSPRCVWLYQREMRALPAGTELKCKNTEMTLVLPVASLKNINLAQLQLNSPTCPVTYNNTHLTARIPLTGCGTQRVHSGSELVYTNTLKSVRPYAVISREPSLVLPLACRIPGREAKGPRYKITIPKEQETFGKVNFWLEFHLPGFGPYATNTRFAMFRHINITAQRKRRAVGSVGSGNNSSSNGAIGSKINTLDLHVMSDCNILRAELLVSRCVESETEDFVNTHIILNHGCTAGTTTLEVISTASNSKIYRMDMSTMDAQGSTMYVECTMNLCLATLPSQKCPDPCARGRIGSKSTMINSVYTSTYIVRSGPISTVVTTPAPATTTIRTTAITTTTTTTLTTAAAATTTTTTTTTTTAAATTTTTTAVQNTTTSNAPKEVPTMTVGVILTAIHMILQSIFHH